MTSSLLECHCSGCYASLFLSLEYRWTQPIPEARLSGCCTHAASRPLSVGVYALLLHFCILDFRYRPEQPSPEARLHLRLNPHPQALQHAFALTRPAGPRERAWRGGC